MDLKLFDYCLGQDLETEISEHLQSLAAGRFAKETRCHGQSAAIIGGFTIQKADVDVEDRWYPQENYPGPVSVPCLHCFIGWQTVFPL